MPRRAVFDRWLFFTASLLAIGGLLMVGSASNFVAMKSGQNPSAYYLQHMVHLLIGFGVLFAAMALPYRRLAHRGVILGLLVLCVALLTFVLAMDPIGGARRWIPLGPFHFQPSELAKMFGVLFMAYVLSRKEEQVNDLWSVPIPCLAVIGTLGALILIEPDLGSAVMLVTVACVMIFVAGLGWTKVAAVTAVGSATLVLAIFARDYRVARVEDFLRTFIDPTVVTRGSNFQLEQSFIAIGSGGFTGVGFGQGVQKAFYVPATHTDFIFSIIGEELGMVGAIALVGGFLLLYWRGMRAAVRAPDAFGFYLALGITHLVVLQGLINICVCLGMLPTKGLPLPFISYGGSSLLATMGATGLLLNVSSQAN